MSQAWEEIYTSQYGRLVMLMTVLSGSVVDAEEAVQEAFARGLGLSGRRPPPEDPAAWLYRVAANVVRGRWRRAKVANRHRGTLAVEPAVTSAADNTDDRLMLLAALRRLPAEQRETLALHYLADLPIATIADRMDVPVGTVKARLSRGRDALAAVLSQDIPPADDPRSVPQPEFSVVRQRVARRARRHIATAAAIVTALSVTGIAWGASRLSRPEPVTPLPSSTATAPAPTPSAPPAPSSTTTGSSTAEPPTQGQPTVESAGRAVGGRLFLVRRECVSRCDSQTPVQRARLLHTADLGENWVDGGVLPTEMWAERVLSVVGDEQTLWILGINSIWGSTDSGKTWQRWPTAERGQFPEVSAGRLWLVAGERVLTATPGTAPKNASTGLPAGRVLRLVARTANAALAILLPQVGNGWGEAGWYGTEDGGQSWQKLPNPCAGTAHPDPHGSELGSTADGNVLWASCSASGAVVQNRELVVSTDSGKTWQARKTMENMRQIVRLHPFSERVAWRYDTLMTVSRTEDGQNWTTVTTGSQLDQRIFLALGADTALVLNDRRLRVTTDGGKTWQDRPMPS